MTGRVGKPTGLSPAEPSSGLGPSGFDPSRFKRALLSLRDSQGLSSNSRIEVDFEALCLVLMHGHDALEEVAVSRETIKRIENIDYWEGNGGDLLDWVRLGYIERGNGAREHNRRWKPLRDSDGSPKGGDAEGGSVHDSAARRDRPNNTSSPEKTV